MGSTGPGEGSSSSTQDPRALLSGSLLAETLATKEHLVIVCGRYEGIDERFLEHFVDLEVSIGDYVLTGGSCPPW